MTKITYNQFKKDKMKWESLGGNVIDLPKEKSTYKPKVWVQKQSITNYLTERNKVISELFYDGGEII